MGYYSAHDGQGCLALARIIQTPAWKSQTRRREKGAKLSRCNLQIRLKTESFFKNKKNACFSEGKIENDRRFLFLL